MSSKKVITLLSDATAQVTSEIMGIWAGNRTIQASISGTGVLSATVEFYGSNVELLSTGVLLANSTLSGTNVDNTGSVITEEYAFMWAKITAIHGINAKVTVTISV